MKLMLILPEQGASILFMHHKNYYSIEYTALANKCGPMKNRRNFNLLIKLN